MKKFFLFLLAALIIIQFFHPKRNKSTGDKPYAIATKFPVSVPVQSILAKACLDCHSNNTRYPWYCNLQPVDWWIDSHVRDGKQSLNFDEYTNKSPRYQFHKMEEMVDLVKENKMPLNSYLWIHKDAKLTPEEKLMLTTWAKSIEDTLKTQYPPDSLLRKK